PQVPRAGGGRAPAGARLGGVRVAVAAGYRGRRGGSGPRAGRDHGLGDRGYRPDGRPLPVAARRAYRLPVACPGVGRTVTALVGPADPLLDALEIAHLADRYPSLTSGGEQQRTAMARALRLRPTLLLADEPTGHQDRGRVDLTLAVLRQHAYSGHAVLISSHDEAVIAGAARGITLADG